MFAEQMTADRPNPFLLAKKCNNHTHSRIQRTLFRKRVIGLLTVLAEQMKAVRPIPSP